MKNIKNTKNQKNLNDKVNSIQLPFGITATGKNSSDDNEKFALWVKKNSSKIKKLARI